MEWLHYGRYLHQRMNGKPSQYIIHQQEFFGRFFRVEPGVLIPRPETELLVEAVLKESQDGRTVDVGTGSGAIAITLALEGGGTVFATDVSDAALGQARANANRLGAVVQFVCTDLLGGFAEGSLECVVSNPPYVPERDRDALSREVREWEPSIALFGGPDGLDVYRRLVPQAQRVLKPGGLLAVEIGAGQSEAVQALLAGWTGVNVHPDLAGIPRVVLARKPGR